MEQTAPTPAPNSIIIVIDRKGRWDWIVFGMGQDWLVKSLMGDLCGKRKSTQLPGNDYDKNPVVLQPMSFVAVVYTALYGGSSADVFMANKLLRYRALDNQEAHKYLCLEISQLNINNKIELESLKSGKKRFIVPFNDFLKGLTKVLYNTRK